MEERSEEASTDSELNAADEGVNGAEGSANRDIGATHRGWQWTAHGREQASRPSHCKCKTCAESVVKCQCCETVHAWAGELAAAAEEATCPECEETLLRWACSMCSALHDIYPRPPDEPRNQVPDEQRVLLQPCGLPLAGGARVVGDAVGA